MDLNPGPMIMETARRAGFDLCGIAPVDVDGRNVEGYRAWIAAGMHGEMRYMTRPEHTDPRALLPGARSVICLGLNYLPADRLPPDQPGANGQNPFNGHISVYAQGRDYHLVMKEMMEEMLRQLRENLTTPFDARVYVDTGAILERGYAEAAGLGWIGKNTCLINQQTGSWFFLGEILTSLELPPGAPPPNRCGTCMRCLEACPTEAFAAPYVLDATRCISYLTIELRGSIPEHLRSPVGHHVFGCDICQDVCPWNRRAPFSAVSDFLPISILSEYSTAESGSPTTAAASLESLARLAPEQFQQTFAASPIKRSKYRGFLRNVAVAMGNSGNTRYVPLLQTLAESDDLLVAEHARWALDQVSKAD